MTPTSNGGPSSAMVPLFPQGDASICWAGEGRGDQEFCLGTETGSVLFMPVEGGGARGLIFEEDDPEAVNGVAFLGSHVAISTRSDVVLLNTAGKGRRAVFPGGAHGVIGTAEGHFIAPLGRSGLLKVQPSTDEEQKVTVRRAAHELLDYYKVCAVTPPGHATVVVCAVRRGGVAMTSLAGAGQTARVHSVTFPGLDVVDVSPLGAALESPGAVALGKDGTLVLFRDVLGGRSPVAIKFDQLRGTAYRVFSDGRSLFVLTSKGLYTLHDLLCSFLQDGQMLAAPVIVQECLLEAVDGNLCWERWLLVVTSDQVWRFDVEQLAASPGARTDRTFKPTLLHPPWQEHEPAELLAVN